MAKGSEVERNQVAVVFDENHRLRFPGFGIAAHARGVRRHSWQCNPDGIGAFVEELENRSSRHVALDHVSVNERRVA